MAAWHILLCVREDLPAGSGQFPYELYSNMQCLYAALSLEDTHKAP